MESCVCSEPWYMMLVNNISTVLIILLLGGEGILFYKFKDKIKRIFGNEENRSLTRDLSITSVAAEHILNKSRSTQ